MDAAAGFSEEPDLELATFLVRLKRTADALEAALRESGRLQRSRRRRIDRGALPSRRRAA